MISTLIIWCLYRIVIRISCATGWHIWQAAGVSLQKRPRSRFFFNFLVFFVMDSLSTRFGFSETVLGGTGAVEKGFCASWDDGTRSQSGMRDATGATSAPPSPRGRFRITSGVCNFSSRAMLPWPCFIRFVAFVWTLNEAFLKKLWIFGCIVSFFFLRWMVLVLKIVFFC